MIKQKRIELNDINSSLSTHDEKKRLGAFYTPSKASFILCEWAIRSSGDRILEPSFGGCDFLEQAKIRLKHLGTKIPNQQLFGSDIHKIAFTYLRKKLGISKKDGNFIEKDFLSLTLQDFSNKKFDTIIGNPPYVSHHNMMENQKHDARMTIKSLGFSLSNKASLWAYFILHSFSFLKTKGRMAWVLPSSFLFAEYSSLVRNEIEKRFERAIVIRLGERIFLSKGSDESTAIVLCEGFLGNQTGTTFEIVFADDLHKVHKLIESWNSNGWKGRLLSDRTEILFLKDDERQAYTKIVESNNCNDLGELIDIEIGIVTGANSFFIINQETTQSYKLPESAIKPILPKFILCKGLCLTYKDIEKARKDNLPCLIINTERIRKSSRIYRYLETFPKVEKDSNSTFKKRAIWHQPDDNKIPDAFFPYMQNVGPRIVLNKLGITSTNTIHRVFFKSKTKKYMQKLIAISILTTFSQLSAEIEGRSYGSGVLKHEPSEAKRIKIYIPDKLNRKEITRIFNLIDHHFRNKDPEHAQKVADDFIFNGLEKNFETHILKKLSSALSKSRLRRQGKKPNV